MEIERWHENSDITQKLKGIEDCLVISHENSDITRQDGVSLLLLYKIANRGRKRIWDRGRGRKTEREKKNPKMI